MASSDIRKTTFGYGPPTKTGKIPFTPPGTDLKCETAYWLWGDLTSAIPPLIVLHGGPGAPGRDWQAIAPLYERHGIPVLLYDQIGCGASSHLRDKRGDTGFWTMDLFFSELSNLKSHFGIQSFDLLGHSCGGMIAVSYALTQPLGLRKLIICSSPASETLRYEAIAKQRAALPREMQDVLDSCEKEGRTDSPEYLSAMRKTSQLHLCRLDPWPQEVEETMALLSEDDTVVHTLYGSDPMHVTGSRKDYDVRGRLGEITEKIVPGGVLLTNGKYDMSQDEVMAPFFTGMEARVKWVRFAESSHMPHLEEQEGFLTVLRGFLGME